jgi:hypothetical protein
MSASNIHYEMAEKARATTRSAWRESESFQPRICIRG